MLGGVAYQDIMGCIFATAVDIPEMDAVSMNAHSVESNGGVKKGYSTTGRTGYESTPLTIESRETNASFGDLIIKPWASLTAHYGLLPMFKHKTDILILEYAKTYQNITQIPCKIHQFEGCCPLSISGSKLDYKSTGEEIVRTSKWAFNKYYLRNNIYLPVPDLLQKSSFNNILNSKIF